MNRLGLLIVVIALSAVACSDPPVAEAPPAVDSAGAPIATLDHRPMPGGFLLPPGALFAWRDNADYVQFSAFALVDSSGAMSNPPDLRDTKEGTTFEKTHLASGARYAAMHAGRHVGWLVVDSAMEASCVGIAADARFALDGTSATGMSGIAFPQARPEASFTRPPSAVQDSVARALVIALLRRQGVPQAFIHELIWDSVVVVTRPGGLHSIVAAAEVMVDSMSEFSEWAFVVVEGRPQDPTLRYAAYGGAPDWEYGRPSLFDVEDLDGDNRPELILEVLYYEGWDYQVLRRGDETWQPVYRGGGGGC